MNAKQANRAARRAAEKQNRKPKFLRGTQEEKMRKILQNGITPEMVDDAYNQGLEEGKKLGVDYTFRTIYAGVLLAASEVYGFGAKRAARLLNRVDEIVATTITTEDAIDAVYDRFGLRLNFDEVLDRVKEVEQ